MGVLRRLDRYLFREVIPPFGVALLAFLAFIALQVVIYLSDAVLSRGAGVDELFRLLGLKLPTLLTLAIPGGVLLAIFWALGRLSSSRELMAFQAVGYPLRRVIVPILLFGFSMSLVSFALSEFLVPRAEELYRREYMKLMLGGREISPREEVFFRGPRGSIYYIHSYQGRKARGVVIYDVAGRVAPPAGDFPAVITAEEAGFSPGGELELLHGRILHFDEGGRLLRVEGFERLRIEVGADVERLILGGRTPAQMSLRELSARIEAMRRAGVDPRGLVLEFHAKIAVAASSFLFAFFGAPVGVFLGRKGRLAGAAAGFLLAGAVQALFLWTKAMARQGLIPPEWGAWLPAVPFVVLGVFLLWRLDARKLLVAVVALFLSVGSLSAEPPFSLEAEVLELPLGKAEFLSRGASVGFGGYLLEAEVLRGWEEDGAWTVEAEGASLSGKDISLEAAFLRVEFSPEGEAKRFVGRDLSGGLTFRGPEKEETIIFSASEAEAKLEGGEMKRLVATEVAFTTCPCFEGAPYSVRAKRIVYVPDQWLFARDIYLSSFGVTVWWLPFYVSRLGDEGPALFPRIGFHGGDPFLRWDFPFVLREEALWGTVGLTFFPRGLRIHPELSLFWEGGVLRLSERGLRLSGSGEGDWGSWKGDLSLTQGKLRAALSGKLLEWGWKATWERVERGGTAFEKAPEVSLSRSFSLGGLSLSLGLNGARYLDEEGEHAKAGVSASLRRSLELGEARLALPLSGGFDLYLDEGASRFRASFSPSLSLGGAGVSYSWRGGFGASPLGYDALPSVSRLSLSLRGTGEGVTQRFAVSWDLSRGKLSGNWTVSLGGFEVGFDFIPYPLSPLKFKGKGVLKGGSWKVDLRGGVSFSPGLSFDDLVMKGAFSDGGFSLRWGLRMSPWPLGVKRAMAQASIPFGEGYRFEMAGEYDFRDMRFVQIAASLYRTFEGCLRLGLEVRGGEIGISLEVPAFPGAKVRFSPLDEALRW